jgi:TAT (twin-arginine translocation) pathway signal sequence
MLKNETPEKVLVRYSRRDVLKGTAVAGLLAAMGMNWRPRSAEATVLRVAPTMTPGQINLAVAQANSSNAPLVFADATYNMGNTALTPFSNIPIVMGEAVGTTITFGTPGGRAAAVIGGGQGADAVRVFNLRFIGPGGAVVKGQQVNNQEGFSIGGGSGNSTAGHAHVRFRDCSFEQFNHNVILENATGHIFFSDCGFKRGTFNVWNRLSNGAYEFIRCQNSNATKANYRLSKGELFENTIWQRGHHTNAPYVFYRTADVGWRSGIGWFTQRSRFVNEQFEWTGNGICHSEVGASGFAATRFSSCGYSLRSEAEWRGMPRGYMIDTGTLDGVIIESCNQWDPGTSGLLRVTNSSSIQWLGKKPANSTTSGPFAKILDHSL